MKFFARLAVAVLAVAAIIGFGSLQRSQADNPAWDTNALIECLNWLSADQTEPGNYLKCTDVVRDLSGSVEGVNLLNLEDCLNALSGLRPGNILKCTLVVEKSGVVDGVDTAQLQECLNRLSGLAPGLPTWEHNTCKKQSLIRPLFRGTRLPLEVAGELTESDPFFNHPWGVPSSCSLESTPTPYDVYTIAHVGGQMTINMMGVDSGSGTLKDPHLSLYLGSFDPNNPCANLVDQDDDSGTGWDARIVVTVPPGTYVIVASAFGWGTFWDFGTYVLTATAP